MKIVQPIGTIAGTAVSKIAITLAEEFARRGHESTLVVWNRAKIARDIDPRVTIIEANLIGVSRRNIATKLLRLVFKSLLGSRLFLVLMAPIISRQLQAKVLNRGDYDIALLHAHSLFGFRHIKTPYIVVSHSVKSKQLLTAKTQWQNALLLKIYQRVYRDKTIITVAEGIRQDFIQHFGLKPDNLTTVYNPFNIEEIKRLSNLPEPDCPPTGSYIIAVGRNDPAKRFDRLLRVYKAANIKQGLVILGRANENKTLQALVGELQLQDKVRFMGFRQNPFPFVKNAALLVLSSDYEGLPSIIIESFICGTPVISTDCPSGPREIMGNELRKYLVDTRQEQQFARKIQQTVTAPYNVPQDIIQRYRQTHVCSTYLEIMLSLTGSAFYQKL